jgi:P-type Ca2+ transporter type 2C
MKRPFTTLPVGESGCYHSLPADDVLKELDTSARGLACDEAALRHEYFGANIIAKEHGTPLWRMLMENLTNFFAVLLWAAAGLSIIIGSYESCIAIIAVIVINAVFSFIQEYRAEQAIAALRKLLPIEAKVRREGVMIKISATDLVPGDILILEEGDNISADARLLREFDLRTKDSALTGESEPVRKTATPMSGEGLMWTQMPNLVFAGTAVASGSGEAAVFATGMSTAFGRIAHLTQSLKPESSPLQIQVGRIAKTVTQLAIGFGLLFFLIGIFFSSLSLKEGLIFAIGIVIANVPEGLLPTLSLALASGAQRLAKRNALVKRLSSVETLGSATVICTDKTGTLTQNQMTVREAWIAGRLLQVTGVGYEPKGEFTDQDIEIRADAETDLQWLLRTATFCNTARLLGPDEKEPQWRIIGDPTEGALLVAAAKAGYNPNKDSGAFELLNQIPFDSRRKRMSVVYRNLNPVSGVQPRMCTVFVKGAPKEVLSLCTDFMWRGQSDPIKETDKEAVIKANDRFAWSGLRVLALACRHLQQEPSGYTPEELEQGLTFIGLMAMQDPPRPEVENAVDLARSAGIRVVMITGDYGLTAESIARKIGIIRDMTPRVITGAELESMNQDMLKGFLSKRKEVLFARVAPEQKLRIVEAFLALGEIVAVTGDGVNDAPALKRSDIGIAMGLSGTDVAKEASEMILLDDNFATIVAAVEEGRAVYDNIRKFVTYIFAHLAGEAIPYILFAMFNLPLPLTVLQILAIDLVTETLPALALGKERPEPDVMQRPPRSPKDKLLDRHTLIRGYFFLGLMSSIGVIFGYFWKLYQNGWHWGITGADPLFAPGSLFQCQAATMVFLGIVIMQVANVFACRTERVGVLRVGFFSNHLIFAGIVFELVFAAMLIYIPFFQRIFGTAPIGGECWVLLFAFTPLVFFAEEARKAIEARARRGHKGLMTDRD